MELLNLIENVGSKEIILNGINSMTKENYIGVFHDYVLNSRNKKDISDFEVGYLRDLECNVEGLAKDLITMAYSKKNHDELLSIITEWAVSAPYSFESYFDNYELDLFIKSIALPSDVKFNKVKDFMTYRLEQYCLSLEKTISDRENERKINDIENYEKSIKHYQEQIAKLKEDLGL